MTMRRTVATLLFLAPLAAGGCATASIEDAVPQAAAAQAPAAAFSEPGNYPNLNVNPTPAAPQITDEEREAEAAALRARRDRQAGEGSARAVADRSNELRRLARGHAADALRQIEGE